MVIHFMIPNRVKMDNHVNCDLSRRRYEEVDDVTVWYVRSIIDRLCQYYV